MTTIIEKGGGVKTRISPFALSAIASIGLHILASSQALAASDQADNGIDGIGPKGLR